MHRLPGTARRIRRHEQPADRRQLRSRLRRQGRDLAVQIPTATGHRLRCRRLRHVEHVSVLLRRLGRRRRDVRAGSVHEHGRQPRSGREGTNGFWYVDRAYNGYGNIDLQGRTSPTLIDEDPSVHRQMWISRPSVPGGPTRGNFSEAFVSPSQLKVGVRYTANVHLVPGMECEFNDDTDFDGCRTTAVPQSARRRPRAPIGSTTMATVAQRRVSGVLPRRESDRRGHACVRERQPGPARVAELERRERRRSHRPELGAGGRLHAHAPARLHVPPAGCVPARLYAVSGRTSTGLHVDYGTDVACTADFAGIYGVVKNKRTGAPIAGASVVAGGVSRGPTRTGSGTSPA